MRSRYPEVMPGAMKAMVALVLEVRHSSLEPALVELVKIRASQMKWVRILRGYTCSCGAGEGESEQRLSLLAVWRDAACYSERECAALRWCEELTLIAQTHASDAAYDEIERWFSEEEVVALTYAIISINSFNRLSVAFRQPVDAPGPCPTAEAARRPPCGGGDPQGELAGVHQPARHRRAFGVARLIFQHGGGASLLASSTGRLIDAQ